MINRKLQITTIVLSAIMVSGCLTTILPEPEEANHVYRLSGDLTASSTAVSKQSENILTVRIDRPNAPKALQGFDLVIAKENSELAIVDKAEWSDSLPTMIQRSFLSELNSRSDIIGILPTSGARSEYRAHITVRNFEAIFDRGDEQAPLIVVDYLVTLSDAGSRKLIGTQSFHSENRAVTNHVSDIVRAKSSSNRSNLERISDWIVATLSNQGA